MTAAASGIDLFPNFQSHEIRRYSKWEITKISESMQNSLMKLLHMVGRDFILKNMEMQNMNAGEKSKKRKTNSNDTYSMLYDYLDMMQQYADFAKKIDQYDTDKMSAVDSAYYLEVTMRVAKNSMRRRFNKTL